MRFLMALVAWAVAVVAGMATVPLLWVSAHVVDEDGYVTFSSQLAATSSTAAVAGVGWREPVFWSHAATSQSAASAAGYAPPMTKP